jgi:nucleoid DNA-binding protein
MLDSVASAKPAPSPIHGLLRAKTRAKKIPKIYVMAVDNFARQGIGSPTLQGIQLPNMNKVELVEAVQKTLGKETSKAVAERSVNAVIDAIKVGVKKTKTVQLIGFGTFKVATRKARIGVNPKTGAKIKIKASKTVKFVAGKALKETL